MKTKALVSIVVLVLAVSIIAGSCATTPKTQEKEGAKQEALFKAIQNFDYDEVKKLIEEGADVNARCSRGRTPLMWAAGWSSPDVVKLLIEAGADINAKSEKEGQTALLILASSGFDYYYEIVEILIEEGANINAQDDNGYTALMYAEEQGLTEIAKLLKEAGAK
ncbi:MAG: ankyrin repeat domain-containing protein [Spirochaetota bacterium]|nr:MAG: ankyrin repeat domain-containing protein [Spirochaetota bacterium]